MERARDFPETANSLEVRHSVMGGAGRGRRVGRSQDFVLWKMGEVELTSQAIVNLLT